MPRSLTLLLALLAVGCPPTRSSGIDDDDSAADDDDTSSGDDDDATLDDDDVSPPPDDDDDIVPPPPPWDDDDATPWDDDDVADSCGVPGEASVWFDASQGDLAGTWFEGELAWDGSSLSVTPDLGPVLAVNITGDGVDLDSLFVEMSGPGRLMLAATSWGPWTANGLLAVQSDWSGGSVVLGVNSPSASGLDNLGYTLGVEPLLEACSEPLFDLYGCGMSAALPLLVDLSSPWIAESAQVWPGGGVWIGNGTFTQYQGWQLLAEPSCSDFQSPSYSWSYQVYGAIDG